jgi:hypothetical protein
MGLTFGCLFVEWKKFVMSERDINYETNLAHTKSAL